MSFTPLQPARLAYAPDGTPKSETFNDIYHSADGGPGQARHVFLEGNGLPERWADKRQFVILENGFGTGLNFLTTWAAWRADPQRPEKLHYFATELHPFRVEDLASLQRKWKDLEFLADALRANWPPLLPGFHRIEFAAGKVVLTLMLGEAEASLRKLRASVDAFYLDGFDPQKNPQMWSPALLKRCGQLAAPNATFATWTVAGQVRRAIVEAGFVAEKKPGFGSKRQMLAGRIAERPKLALKPSNQGRQEAVIIGAGLAGCALAERLAVRGWRVNILDRHPHPAGEASGNLAGILRPMLSRDDNLASRLNRACFLYLEQNWRHLDQIGQPPRRNLNGILQIARDDTHASVHGWPAMPTQTRSSSSSKPIRPAGDLGQQSRAAAGGFRTAAGPARPACAAPGSAPAAAIFTLPAASRLPRCNQPAPNGRCATAPEKFWHKRRWSFLPPAPASWRTPPACRSPRYAARSAISPKAVCQS
jgi:tRNA 5-methylaminomethyl-2-thiouridine biosynthesis bifunctional protein